MRLWIVENIWPVSSAYHNGGSVAVVAADKERARALVEALREENRKQAGASDCVGDKWSIEKQWQAATVYDLAGEPSERVFDFPDAGCC
ncbi:MAG: hypothetical protein V2A79_11590 [Planctomycetota bacterium]